MKVFSYFSVFTLCLLSAMSIASPKTVAIIGDSLSAAYKMPVEQGWPYLLRDELKSSGYDAEFINASVSGATTAAGLNILPGVLAQAPDIVILALGANDGLQGKPLAYIRKNLERLITLTKQSGAQVLLVGIRIPPNYGSAYADPFFDQYATLAAEHDLAYLPFLLEGVAGNSELMMTDGLHPRPKAQKIIMNTVKESLQPLLVSRVLEPLE